MALDKINDAFELMHEASRSAAWWFIENAVVGRRR